MLEPEIKYENCEEIYPSPPVRNGGLQPPSDDLNNGHSDNSITQQCLKRNYSQHIEAALMAGSNGVELGTGNGVGPLHGNGVGQLHEQFNANNPYHTNMSSISNNYYSSSQTGQIAMQQTTPELFKIKRQRRAESNVLFSHPFFNLQDDWESIRSGETLTAKCLSCKVTLRGHKNVSSNFIKHMKRLHPELYKVYENYKLLKFKGYTPNADPTSSGNGYHAQENFFDPSTFLEHMAANVEVEQQQNSVVTEQPPIPTNNNSALGSDTLEYSGDSHTDTPTPTAPSRIASGVRLVSQERILDSKVTATEVDLSARTLEHMSRLLDQKLNGFVTKGELEEERESTLNQIERIVLETINAAKDHTIKPTNAQNQDNQNPSPDNTTGATNAQNQDNQNPSPDNTTGAAMQEQINALKSECEELRTAVQRAQISKRHLQKELFIMDKTMRQRKIIIHNVKFHPDETPMLAVTRVVRDFLQLAHVQISNASTLRQNNKSRHSLLFEVQKVADARAIFESCYKLKNTGMMVENELSPSALKRKNKLLVLRKEILRRNSNVKVLVKNTELIVCGKQFYWDEVEGLSVGNLLNSTDCGEQQSNEIAADQLKQITGSDMNELLNVLKNYDVK